MKTRGLRSVLATLAVLALMVVMLPGVVQADTGTEGIVAVEAQLVPMPVAVPDTVPGFQVASAVRLFAVLVIMSLALLYARRFYTLRLSSADRLSTLSGSSSPFYIRGALAGGIVDGG